MAKFFELLAKSSTVLAVLVGLTISIAAAIHSTQTGASYRNSPLIGVEIIGVFLALLGVLPQLVAATFLLVRKQLGWGIAALVGVVVLIGGIVLAVALDMATIIYAT
jgi:hypothetical protein